MVRLLSRGVCIIVAATILMLAGVYLVLALSTGSKIPAMPVFGGVNRHPMVIAHRGGAGLGPENTLEAFRRSDEVGADVLELDTRMTADGSFVVIHDSTVDRTTNGSGEASNMTLDQLQALDAGYNFSPDGGSTFPFRAKGVRISTLGEVLTEFPEANFIIEAKNVDADKAPRLCSIVMGASAPEKLVIASARSEFMAAFREACPNVPTSATFTEAADFIARFKIGVTESYAPTMQGLQLPERIPGVVILTAEFIKAARERNLFVHGWTINDPAKMKTMAESGIDGIITDRPDLLIQALSEDK